MCVINPASGKMHELEESWSETGVGVVFTIQILRLLPRASESKPLEMGVLRGGSHTPDAVQLPYSVGDRDVLSAHPCLHVHTPHVPHPLQVCLLQGQRVFYEL